eukprot:482227-Amorphochlora_amoeboformis.AAC.2
MTRFYPQGAGFYLPQAKAVLRTRLKDPDGKPVLAGISKSKDEVQAGNKNHLSGGGQGTPDWLTGLTAQGR